MTQPTSALPKTPAQLLASHSYQSSPSRMPACLGWRKLVPGISTMGLAKDQAGGIPPVGTGLCNTIQHKLSQPEVGVGWRMGAGPEEPQLLVQSWTSCSQHRLAQLGG